MPKLHFFVNEDWAFVSHFFERAVAAQSAGYNVDISAHCGEMKAVLEGAGFTIYPHNISRSGTNPFIEIISNSRQLYFLEAFVSNFVSSI